MSRFDLSEHKFSNGLTLLYCRIPESAGFEIAMNIDTGSRDETPETNGVSHFLEHMMFRGSKLYPNSIALARMLEDFGGESNAMTSVESTVYWLRGATRKINDAIAVFADFFLNPNFADLETERSIILQEFANDFNEDGENIDSETLAMQALFGDHPLGLPIIGTENVLQKLSIADLTQKQKRFYVPQNCVLTVTSSLPAEKVLQRIEQCFVKAWPSLPEHRAAHLSRVLFSPQQLLPKSGKKLKNVLKLQNNADNQYTLKVTFPCSGGLDQNVIEDVFLERVLDDGICSRLPATIREKHGLVYDISCESLAYNDVGTFSIDATVSKDQLEKLMKILGEEIQKLSQEKPSEEEMERVRFRYGFDLDILKESEGRLVSRAVTNHFLEQKLSIDEEHEIVRTLTAEHIRAAAQRILSAPRRTFVLIGPKARKRRDDVEKFMNRLI